MPCYHATINFSATVTTSTTTTTPSFPIQCTSHTVYNDATRLVTAAGGASCDTSIFGTATIWVRFTVPGGTGLPRSATNASRCGTQFTGWYTGALPTTGLTTVGTVCYASTASDCSYFNTISVTNCGSYYVYGLIDPPTCNLRYCTI